MAGPSDSRRSQSHTLSIFGLGLGTGGLLRRDEREPHAFSFAKKAVALLRKFSVDWISRSCRRFERDSVALALERLDGPPTHTVGVPTLVVVGSGIGVGHLSREQVIGRHQDGVGDRNDRLLVAA